MKKSHELTFHDLQTENRLIMRRLIIVTTVSFSFMCVEAVGGYLANSLAILTDAARIPFFF